MFRENIGLFLKEKGIRLLGTDGPSVDAVDSKTMDAHHSLNDNGVLYFGEYRAERSGA